jgi:two-component system, LytTR family, response regulator
MSISCLIVDDEPLARNLLSDYVRKIPSLELKGTCEGPLQALEFLKTAPVDLLFLDIQMPEITGIGLMKVLPKKPMVIFTTAYSEYALDGYELDVVDYLLKPISFERFLKAVNKVQARITTTQPAAAQPTADDFIFVKDGTKLVKIMINDILYVEGLKDYVTIHTKTQKVVSLQRLKSLEEQLPASLFARIHNSFIVSLRAITSIHKNEVEIGATFLPVGETFKKSFKEAIEKRQVE